MTPGTTAAFDFPLGAKTLVDLEARYALTQKLALGADNVFDQYPENPAALAEHGGKYAVPELLGVRAFGTLRVRARELRFLIG